MLGRSVRPPRVDCRSPRPPRVDCRSARPAAGGGPGGGQGGRAVEARLLLAGWHGEGGAASARARPEPGAPAWRAASAGCCRAGAEPAPSAERGEQGSASLVPLRLTLFFAQASRQVSNQARTGGGGQDGVLVLEQRSHVGQQGGHLRRARAAAAVGPKLARFDRRQDPRPAGAGAGGSQAAEQQLAPPWAAGFIENCLSQALLSSPRRRQREAAEGGEREEWRTASCQLAGWPRSRPYVCNVPGSACQRWRSGGSAWKRWSPGGPGQTSRTAGWGPAAGDRGAACSAGTVCSDLAPGRAAGLPGRFKAATPPHKQARLPAQGGWLPLQSTAGRVGRHGMRPLPASAEQASSRPLPAPREGGLTFCSWLTMVVRGSSFFTLPVRPPTVVCRVFSWLVSWAICCCCACSCCRRADTSGTDWAWALPAQASTAATARKATMLLQCGRAQGRKGGGRRC